MLEVGDIKVRGISWAGDDAVMVLRSETIDLDERFLARNTEISNATIVPAAPDAPLMPLIIDAVRARASVGEISDVLRGVWGEYRPA